MWDYLMFIFVGHVEVWIACYGGPVIRAEK